MNSRFSNAALGKNTILLLTVDGSVLMSQASFECAPKVQTQVGALMCDWRGSHLQPFKQLVQPTGLQIAQIACSHNDSFHTIGASRLLHSRVVSSTYQLYRRMVASSAGATALAASWALDPMS